MAYDGAGVGSLRSRSLRIPPTPLLLDSAKMRIPNAQFCPCAVISLRLRCKSEQVSASMDGENHDLQRDAGQCSIGRLVSRG